MVVKNLDLEIRDFDPEGAVPVTATLDLFEEEAVHLSFDGQTGPFTPKSSPASGKLTVDARPGLLPESFRRQYMGEFLASPGRGSEAHLTADLEGDLLGVLVGTGNLRLAGLQLGDPAVGQLPLAGEAPVLLTLIDSSRQPNVRLRDAGGADAAWRGLRGKAACRFNTTATACAASPAALFRASTSIRC